MSQWVTERVPVMSLLLTGFWIVYVFRVVKVYCSLCGRC